MKLKFKLLITFLSVSLIPMILIGGISSYVASSTIEKQAFSQLVAVREIKKSQIESYFAERRGDIEVLSGTIQKVLDFSSADALNASAHDNHQYFETFIKDYGY